MIIIIYGNYMRNDKNNELSWIICVIEFRCKLSYNRILIVDCFITEY